MKLLIPAMLLGFVTLVASPGYAQVGGGVKVGVNFADIDDEDDEDLDSKTGLAVGAFVSVPLGEALAFQPEFLYSQKGAQFEEDGDEVTINLDYFQIPLLVRFGGSSGPFLVVGPGLGFRTKANIEVNGDEVEELDDDVESFDFTGIIGAGLQFGAGIVEVRYDHGFRNLVSDEDEGEAKSRTFSILVGFGFGR